jgi:hypothetical protein
MILFFSKKGTFPVFPSKPGHLVKKKNTNTALAFSITVWMKTDKFSQTFTTQRNGRQTMQRMIQAELPLWKQIKILPT